LLSRTIDKPAAVVYSEQYAGTGKQEVVYRAFQQIGARVVLMRNLRSIYRGLTIAIFTIASWTAGEAMLMGRDATPESSSSQGGGAWVAAYMFVLLVVSLGLIVVCKSSGRRDRAKPEVYAEAKIVPKE
jgi:hypothetical protein